jgi:two-component system invasion response regulator UvrY
MRNYADIRVAIADSYAITRKGMTTLLKEKGINVALEASDGVELIKKLEMIAIAPDICILDIGMPVLDGYETINILNNRWPAIKTLIFTTLSNKYNLIRMLSLGAKGYLLKQAEPTELYKAICEINDFGVYQSDFEIKFLSGYTQNITELKKELFSSKELQFIKYCCTELTYKEIADRMNTTAHAIDNYRNSIFLRLSLKSRIGLVMYALSSGVIS